MEKKQRQRKKGGGRKFADGRISTSKFMQRARRYFLLEHSIKRFLHTYNLSRQAYYRFLNTHKWFKQEVTKLRADSIYYEKKNRRMLLQWMKDNPDKQPYEYFLRDIENTNTNIVIPNYEINLSTDAEKSLL